MVEGNPLTQLLAQDTQSGGVVWAGGGRRQVNETFPSHQISELCVRCPSPDILSLTCWEWGCTPIPLPLYLPPTLELPRPLHSRKTRENSYPYCRILPLSLRSVSACQIVRKEEETKGRILGRNWDKSLKSFPPCFSQITITSNNG